MDETTRAMMEAGQRCNAMAEDSDGCKDGCQWVDQEGSCNPDMATMMSFYNKVDCTSDAAKACYPRCASCNSETETDSPVDANGDSCLTCVSCTSFMLCSTDLSQLQENANKPTRCKCSRDCGANSAWEQGDFDDQT
jgi:hypothetical protein